MDFVTTENVAIDYTKVSDSKAALLVYDTLMAAAKMKQRKEKKHEPVARKHRDNERVGRV